MISTCNFCSALLVLAQLAQPATTESPALPDADAFARAVLRVSESYPTDGTHEYWWPKTGPWKGITQDVFYNGTLIAQGDPQGRCHCSGITWEVFMRAIETYNAEHEEKVLHTWTPEMVNRFQFLWFGSDGNKRCIHNAVLTFGIGFEIKDPDDARPGDFVQFWRRNGSGHSCIFREWVRDEKGAIAALRYWSAQKKTNGIGVNTESVGDAGGIILEQTYIVRIGRKQGESELKPGPRAGSEHGAE